MKEGYFYRYFSPELTCNSLNNPILLFGQLNFYRMTSAMSFSNLHSDRDE